MKRVSITIGVFAMCCIACAADTKDAYNADDKQNQSYQTQSGVDSTTTTESREYGSKAPEISNSEASDSPTTTNPEQTSEEPSETETLAPFRGVPINPEDLLSPRLALKIDNAPTALPQEGLQDADIVFEELVEGGLTRFLAVFQSKIPEFVGPIRSGRSTDIPLLMPFDGALFGWSGSNWAFRKLLETVAITDVGLYRNPSTYWRQSERPSPSNLWVRSSQLVEQAGSDPLPPEPLWPFESSKQANAEPTRPIEGIEVDWGSTKVSYRWDTKRKAWKRVQNGNTHTAVDAEGDEVALAQQNVIIQFTKYVLTNEEDANGSRIPLGQVSEGSGTAWILKNGGIVEGRWSKANITVHAEFVDQAGRAIAMSPGSTWILLAPRDSVKVLELDD
ncbi:MAG: DUF3048 domain-containing protein [Actinomycetota bacterium]|nr:DUF3048 domain-containing protein [Actinomycetota bacterium]